jgi:ParB/RepB/Spo0J family partition protein
MKRSDVAEVIEVATSQLSEHSKQAEFSPQMSAKKWREFVAGVAKEGILQPLIVTKGFRVIDGKHRLKAAKELGIESVRVIIEDIPEDKIPAYITETKLNRDDLKPGQKAAMVIRLFYEEERQKAEVRRASTLVQNTDSPDLDEREKTRTDVALAKKAGIGKSSMANLLAVYRNRPDLFERVFNGEISINKAYTQMKADEAPEEVPQENPVESERKLIEELRKQESSLPQIDESKPLYELNNRLVQMRKKALSLTIEVLDESEKMGDAKPEVKESTRNQLLTLTRSCVLALGHTAESDNDMEILAVVHELLNKLSGGN